MLIMSYCMINVICVKINVPQKKEIYWFAYLMESCLRSCKMNLNLNNLGFSYAILHNLIRSL